VSETLHKLQHYHFVQMFSIALDLSPTYEPIAAHHGFVYSWQQGQEPPATDVYYGSHDKPASIVNKWHTGYAWAAKRDALDAVGGFMDFGILGAGDHHMARALIGKGQDSVHRQMHPAYLNRVLAWQHRADEHIKKNIGFIDGTILHYWHGSKVNRRYVDRWKILIENQFNPDADIYRDTRGLYRLTGNKIRLRDQIRAYFRQRNEDGIDMMPGDDKLGIIASDPSQLLPW
jgi:hypothetical protein